MVRDWYTLCETSSHGNEYIYFNQIEGLMKSRGADELTMSRIDGVRFLVLFLIDKRNTTSSHKQYFEKNSSDEAS